MIGDRVEFVYGGWFSKLFGFQKPVEGKVDSRYYVSDKKCEVKINVDGEWYKSRKISNFENFKIMMQQHVWNHFFETKFR